MKVRIAGKWHTVKDLRTAALKVRAYIDINGLGNSDLRATDGELVLDDGSKAVVAYNGNIFEGKLRDWTPETKKLYAFVHGPINNLVIMGAMAKAMGRSLTQALIDGDCKEQFERDAITEGYVNV